MINGQIDYVEATVKIYFEPSHIDCGHCPLLETYSRDMCRRTGEYIIDRRGTGRYCPLEITDKGDLENGGKV